MVCGEPTTISELWPPCQLEWRLFWSWTRNNWSKDQHRQRDVKLRAGDEFWPHRFVRGNWRNMGNPVSDDILAGRTSSIRQAISHMNSRLRYVFYFKSNITPTLRYSEVSQLHYVLLLRSGGGEKPCPDRAAALSGDAGGANWPRRVSISAYLTC